MLPLEDDYTDIIRKAQRGLQLTDQDLAHRAGVGIDDLDALHSGNLNEAHLRCIAAVLQLRVEPLVRIARQEWSPEVELPREGLAVCHHQFSDMIVNSYLVWDPASRVAAAFDTGGDPAPILEAAKKHMLRISDIFLTHAHRDHIGGLGELKLATKAAAHSCSLEAVAETQAFQPGEIFKVGGLQIETRLTRGHSAGGVTYVVRGLEKPVAIVGDAMFAGSMGGGMVSYADALKTNREEIFTLEDETILCPGHGPMTTVELEKANNPFFTE